MGTMNYHLPGQVAKILGIPEAEVLQKIKGGSIRAQFLENIGSYMIPHEEVIRIQKMEGSLIVDKRILLVDRDSTLQDLFKMELERYPGVTVKVATSDKDVAIMVKEFQPTLIVIHLMATLRSSDRVVESLKKARNQKAHIIVIHDHPPDTAKNDPKVREQLKNSGAHEAVSLFGGKKDLLRVARSRLEI